MENADGPHSNKDRALIRKAKAKGQLSMALEWEWHCTHPTMWTPFAFAFSQQWPFALKVEVTLITNSEKSDSLFLPFLLLANWYQTWVQWKPKGNHWKSLPYNHLPSKQHSAMKPQPFDQLQIPNQIKWYTLHHKKCACFQETNTREREKKVQMVLARGHRLKAKG